MRIDKNLKKLPLTKSKPETLEALFGTVAMQPFWVADMEFEIAKPIQKAMIDRVKNSSFGYEYKPDSFFEAQKEWYLKQNGIHLHKNHILFSPSITTSIAFLIENFTSKNNGVIIQPPVFMEFRDVIRKTNRRVIKNPLLLNNEQYQFDFADLIEKAKADNNKTLILCNPHNPVGRVWTKAEIQKIVQICKENDILLISDEIHKDIILFNHQFTSALNFIDEYDKIIVCTSEAKTFNLCGISDSIVIIPNFEIRNKMRSILRKYNLGRTNALTRVALEAGYKKGAKWLENVIQIIEKNVISIENELKNTTIKLIKPEGTYQVWLDFRNVFKDTKEMFNCITKNSGIALNAGHWFGREGALFIRMNVATSNEKVVYAIKKIVAAVSCKEEK